MNNYTSQIKQDFLPSRKRILFAVLNWGIGHATRCVSLIKQLQEKEYQVVIASDGDALQLLKRVFPQLVFYTLPSYDVKYAKESYGFKLKILVQVPKFIRTFKKEKKRLHQIVQGEKIDIIISDNRFGTFNHGIQSIYITHQIRVKSGWTTFINSKIHQKIINNYDACWVPDVEGLPNLSGDLSHDISLKIPTHYIGLLSQFKKRDVPIKYDILVLLSGPEPQRSLLEEKLLYQFKNTLNQICFVKGIIEEEVRKTIEGNLVMYNYLLQDELEQVINQSELVIARSGYSTIMDLAVLQKKAFFIPTPGQSEQIYLAKHLEKQRIAPYSFQKDFSIGMLEKVFNYKGF